MTNLTDKQLATLARVLGGKELFPHLKPPHAWNIDRGSVDGPSEVYRIGSDWDLIGALLLKLRERGLLPSIDNDFQMLIPGTSAFSSYGAGWTTPTDLLCAIADACEELT